MLTNYKNVEQLPKRLCSAFLVSMVCAFGIPVAQAAVMQVTPVQVDFKAAQQANSIMVSNNGVNNLKAQVRVMQWDQENGEDKLVPAKDLVPSPAIMDVAPGKYQTVRLVRMNPSPASKELSYRILLDELPQADMVPERAGVEILLRYSIPVFVQPEQDIKPTPADMQKHRITDLSMVQGNLVHKSDGSTELQLFNHGKHALRVGSLVMRTADGQQRLLQDGLVGYVLAGKEMSWPVSVPYPLPSGVTLEASFNDDMQSQAVPLTGSSR